MKKQAESIILNKIKEKKEEISKRNVGTKVLIGFLIFIFSCFIAGILFLFYLLQGLPTMEEIKNIKTQESTQIFDRNGKILYTIFGDENRKIIPFDEITDKTIYSIISLEDENFFNHGGVDYKGLFRAILGELGVINFSGGGSTITQQFIKNKYLSSERSYIRKLKEMILSMQLENTYSKEEIITMYLNQIPFGSNIYGIEQASKAFFGKNSSDLNLPESAIIAAIPNATTRYSPYGNYVRSSLKGIEIEDLQKENIQNYEELISKYGEEKISLGLLPAEIKVQVLSGTGENLETGTGNFIETGTGENLEVYSIILPGRSSFALQKMNELGYISDSEMKKGVKDLLDFQFRKNIEEIKAPHFVMYVRESLEREFGEDILKKGGLKVFTSLDLDLQEKAQKIVSENAKFNEKNYDAKNHSLLSVDTKNGEILAMVGSRNYFDDEIDGQVNIMTSKRLAGSTFKPFAYLSMLLSGYSPYTIIFDTETNFGEKGSDYEPKNFDGKFMGPMTMGKALGESRNIPAIKAGLVGGIEKTYNIAKSLGIRFENSFDWYGASLPLGTVGSRGIDLLSAYMVFANNGEKIELNSILKIVDQNGVVLKKSVKEDSKNIVLNPEIAYLMTDMLSNSNNRGAGWNSRLQLNGRINLVKTGTSNKAVEKIGLEKPVVMPLDGWTVGSTPQFSTIVWSGNNDGKTMNNKGSGWSASAKTWKEFMEIIHEGKEAEEFKKPEGIKMVKIAKLSGLLPSQNTPRELVQTGIFSNLNIPKEYDNSLKFIEIDKVSKKLPTSFTPEEAIVKAAVLNLHSLKPFDERWEEPAQEWIKKYGKEFLKEYGISDILADIPTEFDNVHTRENTLFGPNFSISSPKEDSLVSNSGFSVVPEISSKNSIAKVEYYINGELNTSSFNYPYIGNISLPEDIAISSKISLKVKIFDELYNSSEKTIYLKIGEDNDAPYTEIVRPLEGQELVAGSTFEVKTLTYDQGGQIEDVIFYLNGVEIGKVLQAPFSKKIEIPRLVGEHKIKVIAIDTAGNSSFDEKTINVIRLRNTSSEINLNLPENIYSNKAFDFSISMPFSETKNLEKIEILAKRKNLSGGEEEILVGKIDDLSSNSTGFFYLTGILDRGNYLIYLKKFPTEKKDLEEDFEILEGVAVEIE